MAEMIEASKRGEWYTVKGIHNGRVVSADIHASQVDGNKHDRDALRRAVRIVGEYEEGVKRGA